MHTLSCTKSRLPRVWPRRRTQLHSSNKWKCGQQGHISYLRSSLVKEPLKKIQSKQMIWRIWSLKWLIRPYFVLNRFTKHFSNSHIVCNYPNHTSIGWPELLHARTAIWLSSLVRASFFIVISHNHSLPGCMRMCKQLFTASAHLNMNLLSKEE